MRSRSVTVAVLVSVLSAGGAVAAHFHTQQMRTDAKWLLERGSAQADEYASTLDGQLADQQLQTFEQRRDLLERVQVWQRGELLLIMLAVVSAFSSYVFYLFRRLREQLVDASEEVDEGALPIR